LRRITFVRKERNMSEKERKKVEKDRYSFWIKTDTRVELERIAEAEYRNLPEQINLALDTFLKIKKDENETNSR